MDGWIDLQVNGYAGVDFNAPGLTVEKVLAVTERLEKDGTVGYLPTLVTGDPEMLIGMVRTVMEARRKHAICEKNILGFFLEGPFISDKPGAADQVVDYNTFEEKAARDCAAIVGHMVTGALTA